MAGTAAVTNRKRIGPDTRPGTLFDTASESPSKETTKLMEHRWNERKSLALDVQIYHQGVPVARCRTRDLSLDGMQLCVGPLGFYKNTPLDLEFTADDSGRRTTHRVGACVVHCTRNRMGLMLLDVPPETKRVLRRLLTGTSTPLVAPPAAAASRHSPAFTA